VFVLTGRESVRSHHHHHNNNNMDRQQEIEMLLGLFSYVCLLHLLDSQGAIEPIVVMIVLMLET
jgi:hypothetical protein